MKKFLTHRGMIAICNLDDVDTDRIVPARYLSRIERQGYQEFLFKDLRGPEFPLDQPSALGATILIAGKNFGCGSSREHAVWAIQQAGFAAVIAKKTSQVSGFSDIFRQNALNCGLLLIELYEKEHEKLVKLGSGHELTIDLPQQQVLFLDKKISFEIDLSAKDQLMAGLDLLDTTLLYEDKIAAFEKSHEVFLPAQNVS